MTITIRQQTSVCLPILLLACACSADSLDLGGGTMTQAGAGNGRCAESTVLSGDVLATQQPDLEALAGCEEITGDLRVVLFPEASLLPLSSLRVVGGAFELGVEPLPSEVAFSNEEVEIEVARLEALREQGWLPTLAGLEALTHVGSLFIAHALAPDLQPLRQLEAIQGASVSPGWLGLVNAKNLRDLAGLENLRVERISLIDNQLESLDGLQLDETLLSISIDDNPNLTDIQALAPVKDILESLSLSNTGIENVAALSGLETVRDGIALIGNRRLVDISHLAGLSFAPEIQIRDNDQLTALPSLEKLDFLESLFIIDNAALEEIHLPDHIRWSGMFFELGDGPRESHLTPARRVEIQRNPSLRRFTSAGGPVAVQFLTIEDNTALTHIDLPATERVDALSLTRNASLANLSVPSLLTVDALEVVDNPLLSAVAFENVQTFERVMAGNSDSP